MKEPKFISATFSKECGCRITKVYEAASNEEVRNLLDAEYQNIQSRVFYAELDELSRVNKLYPLHVHYKSGKIESRFIFAPGKEVAKTEVFDSDCCNIKKIIVFPPTK